MGWKNLSYPKKGAIIGVIIGLIWIFVISPILRFLIPITENIWPTSGVEWFIQIIYFLIIFLICIFIGWIISKIRGKNEK